MNDKLLICEGVKKSFGKKQVLKGIDLVIEPAKIYGLIGRNGVGKTTLLGVMTAQSSCKEGSITYGGERVWENEKVLENICFSRELSQMLMMGQNNLKAKEYLKMASIYLPHWDKEYAKQLIEEFNLDLKKKICKMNKGMLSMVTIVIALASRSPITILDEPVAGLDVFMRDKFYTLLLQDYTQTQRTFIISTHIIEEAANILEEVIILNNGVIEEKENTDQLISQFRYISGKQDDVDAICEKFDIMHTETVGRLKNVCVRSKNGNEIDTAAQGFDVDVSAVPLQKIFVYLTGDAGTTEVK